MKTFPIPLHIPVVYQMKHKEGGECVTQSMNVRINVIEMTVRQNMNTNVLITREKNAEGSGNTFVNQTRPTSEEIE